MKHRMHLRRFFAAAAAFTLLSTSLHAQPIAEAAKALAGKLPKGGIVTGEQTTGSVPSFAVAGSLGLVDTPPEKVIFEIGSITKVFTALLLAQAVTEGKVTLDTTIKDLMGDKAAIADPQLAATTLKQLATHTSGLPTQPDNLIVLVQGKMDEDPYSNYDRDKLLAYLKTARLSGKPPFKESYSNLGVGLLGYLLAQLYDKPWEDLIRDKITGPLGMKDTSVLLTAEQQKRFAQGFRVGGDPASHWNSRPAALVGCGGLRSTASDMMRFGAALLEPEKTPLKEAIALLLQAQNKSSPTRETCLCLVRSTLNGKVIYWHNGQTGGFHSMLRVEPETKTVQVALGNIADGRVGEVITGSKPVPPSLAVYEGTYMVFPGINYTVQWREGALQFMVSHQAFLPLTPGKAPDTFEIKAVPAEIVFSRKNDKVIGVTLKQSGREIPAVRVE